MKAIKTILSVAIALTATACRTNDDSGAESHVMNSSSLLRSISIDGDVGDALMEALRDAGIDYLQNPSGVGANYLAVHELSCQSPVVANPSATCRIVQATSQGAPGSMYPVFGDKANKLHTALLDAGARFTDGAVVGVSETKAESIECYRAVAPGAQGRCTLKVQNTSSQNDPDELNEKVEVDGAIGNDLLKAIRGAGIDYMQNPGGVGANYLAVQEISCQAPVVPNPSATCRIVQATSQGTPGSMYPVSGAKANKLHAALLNAGASFSEGMVLGVSKSKAQSIECFRAVAPNALGRCTMLVQGQTL